jgi:hypothetical protein
MRAHVYCEAVDVVLALKRKPGSQAVVTVAITGLVIVARHAAPYTSAFRVSRRRFA